GDEGALPGSRQEGEEDRDPALHVEDAGAEREVPGLPERLRVERADGADRVEVPEEERPAALRAEAGEDTVPAPLERDPPGRDARRAEPPDDPLREARHRRDVARGALADDERLEVGLDRRGPRLEE